MFIRVPGEPESTIISGVSWLRTLYGWMCVQTIANFVTALFTSPDPAGSQNDWRGTAVRLRRSGRSEGRSPSDGQIQFRNLWKGKNRAPNQAGWKYQPRSGLVQVRHPCPLFSVLVSVRRRSTADQGNT
jgi:hypothetical protein